MANPSQIGTCVHWWNATNGLTGDPVTAWADDVGSENLTSVGGTPNQVTVGPNSLTAVRFDQTDAPGTREYIRNANFTTAISHAFTIFAAIDILDYNDGNNRNLIRGVATNGNMDFRKGSAANELEIWSGGSWLSYNSATAGMHLYALVFNNTASKIFRDRTELVEGNTTDGQGLDGIEFAVRTANSNETDCIIGEVAVFTGNLEASSSDWSAMWDYFERWTVFQPTDVRINTPVNRKANPPVNRNVN